MEQIARELIRAVRGRRSQEQLSRRLGYRSNPVSEWEGGRRWPTASEFLRVCVVCGIEVAPLAATFHPPSAPALGVADDKGVAAWLTALRGNATVVDVARRIGVSRSAVSRWMSGAARPRLPAFLALIDACTGRLADFVDAMGLVDRVPSVALVHRQSVQARRLLFEHPWAVAVWACLQTPSPPIPPVLRPRYGCPRTR